jgi:hypothetical protein
MNANELANLLEVDSWYKLVTREEIATMLRQQQAEIEALKKQCLDEIFKRTYADRSAEVMEQYWQEAQANATRYEWLKAEFAAGRETYLAEGIPSGEELDKYIDEKANK